MRPIYLCVTCSVRRQEVVTLSKLRAYGHVFRFHRVRVIERLLAYTIKMPFSTDTHAKGLTRKFPRSASESNQVAIRCQK